MPLFNKENQAKRQEQRAIRKALKVESKNEKSLARISNRGTLFGQVGGIVDSFVGSSQNSPVTGTRELNVAQNPDGTTDMMQTLKNFAPLLIGAGVLVFLMKGKKMGRRRR